MDKLRKYLWMTAGLWSLLLLAFSCTRDTDLDTPAPDDEPLFDDCYSLNLTVTLDDMGGTRASVTAGDPYSLTKYENYINLERFRLLFFDHDGYFLFESKNRWVKQLETNDGFSSWFVSVPFGPFGNDSYGEGLEYNWDAIRLRLTREPFKVAILANRPAQLYYPGFTDSELSLPNNVFDNDGPYWGPESSGVRSIFDLHHFQYDIIYADKGTHSDASKSYYDFVMDEINTTRPTMGSAINWVSFDNGDTDKETLTSSVAMRHVKMPSEQHPIPMYGIQEFDPIPAELWREGTPFDLSNKPSDVFPGMKYTYRSIALLRSCVRLDLVIPKSIKGGAQPTFVTLWYSNIYSRTEPMDTWTPTDQIWKSNHDKDCEWKNILSYGPISSNTAPGNGTTKADYQKRISWFYGAWEEQGWKFMTRQGTAAPRVKSTDVNLPYPRIYNPCIQRNKVIWCNNGYVNYNDNNHHYVVYTGERNVNDPNTLPDMTKNPYIACWVISWDKKNYYCIPLLDYDQNNDNDLTGVFGPHTDDLYSTGNWPAKMNTYMNSLPSKRGSNLPYPLLRNHIYRFTLTGTRAGEEEEGIAVDSEVLQSPDINFSDQVERIAIPRFTGKQTKLSARSGANQPQ